MNDERPYDEQWSGLPLPDAGKAWQKMEALLDEDERRRRVLPWWFWRRAAVGLALLGLLAGGWWWLRPTDKKARTKTSRVTKHEKQTAGAQRQATAVGITKIGVTKKSATESVNPSQQSASPNETEVANPVTPIATVPAPAAPPINKPVPSRKEKERQPTTAVVSAKGRHTPYGEPGRRPSQKLAPSWPPVKKSNSDKAEADEVAKKKEATVAPAIEATRKDSVQQKSFPRKDSSAAKDPVKTAAPLLVQTEEKKKRPKKKSAFVFSAGIGLQQAIALQRQPAPPADSSGRKNGFFDYFPSVYAKVQRGKWAAQADAQYSLPQPVAGFSFSQKTTYDATAAVLETERLNLRKLYYHQLSISINYDLLPQWSAGLGGVYNIFAGAVTEREFSDKYTATGAEVVYKKNEPIKSYKDSFFYKTTAGLLLQTDYHWKRFSLGLRYTQNLQPFIKYTEPGGTVMARKNNALQAVLRFQLWTSR